MLIRQDYYISATVKGVCKEGTTTRVQFSPDFELNMPVKRLQHAESI
jgi:hypothetical protein